MKLIFILFILTILSSCTPSSYLTIGENAFTECPGNENNNQYKCKTPNEISYSIGNDKSNQDVSINYPPYPVFNEASPILKKQKFIKIWVAPYIDRENNLHWAGYIYHPTNKQIWNYGINDILENDHISPHQIEMIKEDKEDEE